MAQYIDKDALVVEIERLLLIHTKRYNELAKCEVWITAKEIEYIIQGLKEALSIINTLEVKEVDLDAEINKELETRWKGEYLYTTKFRESAKHFFELGMQVSNKAQKGEGV